MKLRLQEDGTLKGVLHPAWPFIAPSRLRCRDVHELEKILTAYMKLGEEKTTSLGEKLIQRLTKRKP